MVSFAELHNAECHYAECHYAKCHYAKCHCSWCRLQSCIMLSVIMLSVMAPGKSLQVQSILSVIYPFSNFSLMQAFAILKGLNKDKFKSVFLQVHLKLH